MIVTRDVTLGGVELSAGARLVIVFSSANRDEAIYDDPDEFDPDRENLRQHLAFGKGIHFCLGANLSATRGTGGAAGAEPDGSTRSASPTTNEYRYFPSFMLRGLTSLDIELVPATSSSS